MSTKETIKMRFDSLEAELQELSRWMYENPEVAYEEHQSSARLAQFLETAGFAVEHPAHGLETAFRASVGHGPEVVICAEYDALPGVGHACGHNLIATAALGAGAALAPVASKLGVTVTVLGTPAEEHFGGKVDLIGAGAFESAAAAMMIHPSPLDILDPAFLAVKHVDVEFHGKDSHASFAPQVGRNALDAFVSTYVNVSNLRQHLYATDKVHGIISHGGDAPNIIPSYTRSSWYVRADSPERLVELVSRFEDCVKAGATASGCTYDIIEMGHTYDSVVSNPVLAELFDTHASELGRTMLRGSDMPPGATGSTDMGNVSYVVPSIHPMLGINSMPAVNHQPEFAAHTITADGEKALRDGALAMAWTIADLAEQNLWDRLERDRD